MIDLDSEIASRMVVDLVYRDVGRATPSDLSWKQWVRALTRIIPRIHRALILPRPAGLTARQREKIRGLSGSRPTAVVTGSLVNRCIITSLSCVKVPIRAFAPGTYREALAWLGGEPPLPAVMQGFDRYPPLSPRWPLRRANAAGEHDAPPLI